MDIFNCGNKNFDYLLQKHILHHTMYIKQHNALFLTSPNSGDRQETSFTPKLWLSRHTGVQDIKFSWWRIFGINLLESEAL